MMPKTNELLIETIHINQPKEAMKNQKPRKIQEERLLKRLSLRERRQQEAMRRLILIDPTFRTA
jgi:hypothetical protein